MSNVVAFPLVDAKTMFSAGLKLYREGGLPRGQLTGWTSVDELYSVAPSQWTVITGIPQSGKSEWLDALLVNLAEADDWQFAIYSPENWPPATHLVKLVEKLVRKPYNPGPSLRMTEEEYRDGALWVLERFAWLDPDAKSPLELIATALGYRKPSKRFGIVLDPWNTLDHERSGLSDTDYISTVLTDVTRTVRAAGAHCWLVVHPQKIYKDRATGQRPVPTPYDISGSAHWYNKADNIITVHREQGTDTQDVEIHVQKCRFKHIGHIGMATLKWDKVTGRYFQAPRIFDPTTGKDERYADPARA